MSRSSQFQPRMYRGKRLLDLGFVALIALPALLCVLVCALAIAVEDGGPILLRQTRIGAGGRPFTLFKLRTMARNAEPESEVPDATRITRVGCLLRRLSLDELPQLVNVVRGDMSVVGPRPNFAHRRYDGPARQRLAVLPGLTGLAQIYGRNQLSWSRRTELDIEYTLTQSLGGDLKILLRSVWVVLAGDGVQGHPREPRVADTWRLEPSVLEVAEARPAAILHGQRR